MTARQRASQHCSPALPGGAPRPVRADWCDGLFPTPSAHAGKKTGGTGEIRAAPGGASAPASASGLCRAESADRPPPNIFRPKQEQRISIVNSCSGTAFRAGSFFYGLFFLKKKKQAVLYYRRCRDDGWVVPACGMRCTAIDPPVAF